MPWSLARGCFRTGKLERSPARCPRKTSLWRSGKGPVWQVRQLMIFRVGILFLFSFSDTCVSRLCAAAAAGSFSHPLFTVSSKSLSCKERHHGWDGTLDLNGCCCRWVLWLTVWADWLFCFLLAIVSLFGCLLLSIYFLLVLLVFYYWCIICLFSLQLFCVFCLLLLLPFFFFFFFASISLLVHCFVAFIVCLLCSWQVSGRFLSYFALFLSP